MMASALAKGNHNEKCKVCKAFVRKEMADGGVIRYYCGRCETWRMEWVGP